MGRERDRGSCGRDGKKDGRTGEKGLGGDFHSSGFEGPRKETTETRERTPSWSVDRGIHLAVFRGRDRGRERLRFWSVQVNR